MIQFICNCKTFEYICRIDNNNTQQSYEISQQKVYIHMENQNASITARDISQELKDDFLAVIDRQKINIKDSIVVFMQACVLYPDTVIPELLTKVNSYSPMAQRKDYSDEDKIALFDLDTRYYQLNDAIRNSDNELSKEEFRKMRDRVVAQKKAITDKYK